MCRKILEPLIVKKSGMFVIKSISLGEILKDSFIKNEPYGCDSVCGRTYNYCTFTSA